MAKSRLERECGEEVEIYYLDLIAFRNVSNYIAVKSGVIHESPQLIIFKDGKVIADASHIAVRGEMVDLLKD
jgi:bacillithiol system protein YtxJ